MRWLRAATSRIWHRLGRRGVCLLFFAFLDFSFGLSYYFPAAEVRRSSSIRFVESIAPLWVWGTIWTGVGLVLLVNAFRNNDRVGFACAVAIKVLWALIYVVAAFAHVERAWLSASLWTAIAGWVAVISTWPEQPETRRDDGG